MEREVRGLVEELRARRLALGLSLEAVSGPARISPSLLSRIERHRIRWPRADHLAAIGAVLGLDLRLRAHPGGEPLRDRVQVRLLPGFRVRCHPSVEWRYEAGLPIRGDRRAWDAVAICQDGGWTGIEGISRLGAVDATLRPIHQKRRDDPRIHRLVLVVADTARNRQALRVAADVLREAYPLDTRGVLADMGAGRTPRADGLVILRVPAGSGPQAVHTGGNPVDAGAPVPRKFVDNPVGGAPARR